MAQIVVIPLPIQLLVDFRVFPGFYREPGGVPAPSLTVTYIYLFICRYYLNLHLLLQNINRFISQLFYETQP